LKVLKTFQETDDATLLEIVKEILTNKEFKITEEYQEHIHSIKYYESLGGRGEIMNPFNLSNKSVHNLIDLLN